MAAEVQIPTPRERLAQSRAALVEQLEFGSARRPVRARWRETAPRSIVAMESRQLSDNGAPAPDSAPAENRYDRFAWSSLGQGVLRRWWRRHPANAAVQLAQPLLERYARQEPARLVAASAATGALLALTRPWRLLSATTVLALMLKSSDVADLVTTLIQNNATPRKEIP